jgi:hypothetical protein
VVNYSGHSSQSYVGLPWNDLPGQAWRLSDRLRPAVYERSGEDLKERGLYLDLPAWGYHAFEVEPAG